jgi:hypothetical protein
MAIQNIGSIDRTVCRQQFEERFTAYDMSSNYLRLYQALVRQGGEIIPAQSGVPIG